MCGIAGLIVRNNTNFDIAGILHSMTSRISHRGPDSNGSWIDEGERVGLGHRRLSILDLSEAGSQPMISPNGRYVIVLNGEIYNFHEIRARLTVDFSNEIQFVGHSDTEILLNAIERYGVLETLKLAHGMFAFALWDKQEREIYFARDRFGEKPLYYGFCPEGLVFASELSCFKEFGRKYWEIDRDSLALFFRHNYIPAPYTIFKNVWKLRPGHLLKIHINSVVAGAIGDFVSAPYWSLLESARNAENTIERSPEIYENELEDLLRKAIGQQMIADVSLGAFLSGGVDSSLIVGIMQSISNVPVKTFTLGFNETGFDEAVYAKKIADHLGTSHSELYVTPRMALDLVPKMSQIYSEPFSDSSQIPTALICMQARKKVTVALSGDAGDELFGGYDRYFQSENFWKLHGMGGQRFNSFASRFFGVIGKALRAFPSFSYLNKITDKTQRISDFFLSKDFPGLYKLFVSHHKEPCSIVLRSMREPESMLDQIESFDFFHSNFERMMFTDLLSYLPDDILVKVDRAAMSVGLETRVPFLDPSIVEFSFKLPLKFKKQNGQGKTILRKLLNKFVPRQLVERPKMGFAVPLGSWLRKDLKGWASDLLQSERLCGEGFLDSKQISKLFIEHQSGQSNNEYILWDALMFQSWLEEWKK